MELSKYLEYNICKSKVFSKILSSQQKQIDRLNLDLKDLEDQAYISTSTWGLKYWEQELGITIEENDTYEDRRSRCLSKIRGNGNCTIDYIKKIALSYKYGDVNVIEDYENYKVTIKFTNSKGIPKNIKEFKAIVRIIMPAHLIIEYEFSYNTVNYLKGYTVGELRKYTVEELKTSNINHGSLYESITDENDNNIADENDNIIVE